jgi:hypothetical protein
MILVESSRNAKLMSSRNGKTISSKTVAVTYRPVGSDKNGTCPPTCSFLGNGCYAQRGRAGIAARRAEREAEQLGSDGKQLRKWLELLPKTQYIRHHVSGDVGSNGEPDYAYIKSMVEGHKSNPALRAWGYTHFWAVLNPEDFNAPGLCINASADSIAEALEAKRRGWDVAVVAPKGEKRLKWREGGELFVVCPNQVATERYAATKEGYVIGCAECQLCLIRNRKQIIVFRKH